jgi:CDP-glucose 4,6-dehydratase
VVGARALEGLGVTSSTFWKDRPVFVTGCTGLLGSWLVRALVERGASVVGLVRDWVPQSELTASRLVDRIQVVRGDVRDRDTLERALGEFEVEAVFHLAAQTIVGVANANPVSTLDTNVRGTWSLLEACRRSPRVRQIVVASSDKAYGAHEKLPYDEDAPLQGRHPYDVSKSCADLITRSYAATYGLPVCVTRCGNLYGGGDLNWNRLVPGTIRSALANRSPVIRSDGTFVRDYFYVEDAALAYLALAEAMANQPSLAGEAFNFSNEIQVSAKDMALEILRVVGRPDLPLDIRGTAGNEIPHQYLDASKAKRVLDWRPSYDLDEGLRRTVGWYTEFLGHQRGAAN